MKKRISWPWFFIRMLPIFILIIFMIGNIGNTSGINYTSISQMIQGVNNMFIPIYPIEEVIGSITEIICQASGGDYLAYEATSFTIKYIAYLILMEITKIFYEVIAFLPKFCTSIFERKTKEK